MDIVQSPVSTNLICLITVMFRVDSRKIGDARGRMSTDSLDDLPGARCTSPRKEIAQ
jgi:hypothetical protein